MSDKNETVENDGEDLAATVANLQAQLTKLAAKNKELLGEKQAAKQATQKALDDAEEAKTATAERNGDIETLKAQHAKELKKAQEAASTYDAMLRKLTLDNEIANGITSNNVRPELAKAVTALMKADAEYKDGVATISGQPIADYMKTYLGGKDGAHFVRAADNSGGGAIGSSVSVGARMTKENWNWSEYGKMYADNPSEAKAVAQAAGVRVPE